MEKRFQLLASSFFGEGLYRRDAPSSRRSFSLCIRARWARESCRYGLFHFLWKRPENLFFFFSRPCITQRIHHQTMKKWKGRRKKYVPFGNNTTYRCFRWDPACCWIDDDHVSEIGQLDQTPIGQENKRRVYRHGNVEKRRDSKRIDRAATVNRWNQMRR